MLEQARILGEEAPDCAGRIRYVCKLLPEVEGLPRAAAVISNALLHHLHNPQVLWESAKLLALPGAPIFVMDLFRPASLRQAKSVVEQYAAEAPDVLKRDFYNSLLAAFRVDEVKVQLQKSGLSYLHVEEISDRHLAVWGRAKP